MASDKIEALPTDPPLPDDHPKVFLSYSRRDRERAQLIADYLRDRAFGVFRDTDDILPTEEWRDRLQQLIEQADTIVFLLSPHSAQSEVCAWEVEYAASLNKRIAPIVISDVDASLIPSRLAQLNFIFATERDPFENAVDTLISALNTDIDWIREHTRLAGLARRWHQADRPRHLLLRGQDIEDAETWRDSRPAEAPNVLPLQAGFIAASRRAADRRLRQTVIGAVVVSLVMGALSALAMFQSKEIAQRAAVLSADAARAISAEGNPDGALAVLLEAASAFNDRTAPHSVLIAFDEVLQRALAETRHHLSDDTVLIDDELGFVFYTPSSGELRDVNEDGGLETFARLENPLIAVGSVESALITAEVEDGALMVTRFQRGDEGWKSTSAHTVEVDGLTPENASAFMRPDGVIRLSVGDRDVLIDPMTGARVSEGQEGLDEPSLAEMANLPSCLAGFSEVDDLTRQLTDILEQAEYSVSATCKRRGGGALFTLFDVPNAGVIRKSYIINDGWIEEPRTAMMLDHIDGDIRSRYDEGLSFDFMDFADPLERTLRIVRGDALETEPPLEYAFEGKIVAVRFLKGDRLAVYLGPRAQARGRLVIFDPAAGVPYRSPKEVDVSVVDRAFAGDDTDLIAYDGSYEITKVYKLPDPSMVVVELHVGMSQVEAWMYSLETNERWRKLGRNHNFVHIVIEEDGAVLSQDYTGTYRFDGLHSLSEAITAAHDALPVDCRVNLRSSPCWPSGFDG